MSGFDEAPYIDLGRSPIPGAAPCGSDVAEDEEYILVQAEMAKLDRIEAGEPDWRSALDAAANILRNKSKDLDIASILGMCLFKREGYAGLAASLKLIHELVTGFEDGCFPDRPRRRKARIEALADRFTEGGWFRDFQPKPDEFDAVDACAERINDLDAALRTRMPDDPPDFSKFVRGIRELAQRRPRPDAAAVNPPSYADAANTASGASAGGTFAAPAEVTDTTGAANAILAAATFLRKADPADPLAYALIRDVRWARIMLPTSDAAKTQLEPPESSLVETLTHQFNNSMWENLLKNSEAAFRSNDPLWLDLQRYVCSAMAGLGATYDRAKQTVMHALAGLVRRLGEGLYDLRFRNGTALCSGETRLWIESEVCPSPQASDNSISAGNRRLTDAAEKARKLAGEGKVREALEDLQAGLVTSTGRRDRLLWRLTMARLCHDVQRLQVALPLLDECREDVQRYRIDEWEPVLALDVAQMCYRCRKAIVTKQKEPTRDEQQGVRDSFAWLCQLDPLAALSAEPSGA